MTKSCMARRALVAGAVVVVFLVGAAVAPGDPGNGEGSLMFRPGNSDQPFDVAARFCGFTLHFVPLRDMTKSSDTTLPDGTEIFAFTGESVGTVTNADTGKTILLKGGASGTITFYPDGSRLYDLHGYNVNSFGPIGQANTGEPGFVLFIGHVILTYGNGAFQSATASGRQENLCAELS